jgi:hypothetical protein
MNPQRTKRLSRRNFLLALGAGGAATAAAIAARTAGSALPQTNTDKRSARGYHASGHIDNYYRTAKV